MDANNAFRPDVSNRARRALRTSSTVSSGTSVFFSDPGTPAIIMVKKKRSCGNRSWKLFKLHPLEIRRAATFIARSTTGKENLSFWAKI